MTIRRPDLVERIRDEAALASRPGQLDSLEAIADEVAEMQDLLADRLAAHEHFMAEAWEQGKQYGYALTVRRMTDGWIEADKFARQHGGNPYRPESQVLEPIERSKKSMPCKANLHGNCADCSCFCHPI